MAITLESIYNLALGYIGVEEITSVSEGSTASKTMNTFYETTRDALLADYDWNFARTRTTLTALGTIPAFEFNHQFTKPTDCMRIVRLKNDPAFAEEGALILCNDSTIYLKYISNSLAVTTYPMVFIEALAYSLAAKASYKLTQKLDLRTTMETLCDKAIAKARHINAINKTPIGPIITTFLDARTTGLVDDTF